METQKFKKSQKALISYFTTVRIDMHNLIKGTRYRNTVVDYMVFFYQMESTDETENGKREEFTRCLKV